MVGEFTAMASPCEVLIDDCDPILAKHILQHVVRECRRIERQFSRYRNDNIVHKINHARGQPVSIDEETFKLLSFAQTCYVMSDGLFDITAGVLNRGWHFDGSDRLASEAEVQSCLPLVGFDKIQFNATMVTLPAQMSIDFGGIAKEYAVDMCAQHALSLAPHTSVLINFGGDIAVSQPRKKQTFWRVGISHPDPRQTEPVMVQIARGGLATSGDANRFLIKDGVRYSHILNPKTGYPITAAPASVTVAGENCTQAGLLATLSLLQGNNAEAFLRAQGLQHWCIYHQ